ncbi:MAG TPA: hypothetical protein VFH80_14480 [Solirubrobacteraceae bacterium]|nr:hypothetical protein [Solirubrobacteraceae bacterium]
MSYARAGGVFDRVLSLLRPGAAGPMLLRVGGTSADDAYWEAPTAGSPPWVFSIGDDWLRGLAGLARRDNLQVTLDLNLAVHSPAMAVRFARAAYDALSPSRLAGLAIGNEPDLFEHQPGLARERVGGAQSAPRTDWTLSYSPTRYRHDYLTYARALEAGLPGVPLAGPESASVTDGWLHALDGMRGSGLTLLTVHRYPFSLCWAPDSPLYPRISSLLSESASAGLADGLLPAIAHAHRSGLRLWVSEMNSVSCGGNQGVADSFATALWAPDALFELMSHGVDGVNWHIRPGLLNAPFELHASAIQPLPELYGLALFGQMLGPDARRVDVSVSETRGLHLKVWATRSSERTRVLLINKGARAAAVSLLSTPAGTCGSLERLSASSIRSVDDVTLAGRPIGSDGRWLGRALLVTVCAHRGVYHVRVPRYSAVLLTQLGGAG